MSKQKAQSLIEYALIFSAVIAAASVMTIYSRRSVSAKLKRTAVGLEAVFQDINTMPAPAVTIPPEPVEDLSPEPPEVISPTMGSMRDLINSGDFARGLDLFTQAQNAFAGGDVTVSADLLAQGLALLNIINFNQLKAIYEQMDASIPGISEIIAGISEFERGMIAAREAKGLLDDAASLLTQADALAAQANAATTPEERDELLRQRDEALRERDNKLTGAQDALSVTVNALSSAKELFNSGIDLMENAAR